MNSKISTETGTLSTADRRSRRARNRIKRWFLEGKSEKQASKAHHVSNWWNVMCLTGVDYFSTLGYQPSIAFVAAGYLSPPATAILVLLTLFGALPVYKRVAEESPHGSGSISMLERLLPGWKGKAFVLALLGFAATSFIVTITLSAADATSHIVENPMCPHWMENRMGVTCFLITLLGGVFLMGFREAIGIAVVTVAVYLVMSSIVIAEGFRQVIMHPQVWSNWSTHLNASYNSPWLMVAMSLMYFPKLALGLSGFETGVTVMPLVKGDVADDPHRPEVRTRNTKKLLTSAAAIMSVFLITSSLVTTLLIPAEKFHDGGEADGRALAYIAHSYLGEWFGTAYDVSTIVILWFAGASALVGLLNLVPRYLPRYGMAPDWARAFRPLVLVFTVINFVVTIIFKADVDAQAGAYATGVLMLITSATVAVALLVWNRGGLQRAFYGAVAGIFVYTTVINMVERPEGLHIALFFVAFITVVSMISRAIRSIELRIETVNLDDKARQMIEKVAATGTGDIRVVAHRPGGTDYASKEKEARETHSIQENEGDFVFLEVTPNDTSSFQDACLDINGHEIEGYFVLRCESPAVPNAIAALLLHIRETHKKIPHAYFGWTEGNPLGYIFKYIFFGEGETAPVTREILRQVETDPKKRPKVHVG